MRQEIHCFGGVTVIDDSYNASPDSMKSGLGVLASLPCAGRKLAVLGDMLELGDRSEEAHEATGRAAAGAGGCARHRGERARRIAAGAREADAKLEIASL